MSLGQKLKQAREKKGLTRQEFSDLAGINVNSLSKYERAGEKSGQYPPMPVLARMVRFLSIVPESIFAAVAEDEETRAYFSERRVRSLVPLALARSFLDELESDISIRQVTIDEEIRADVVTSEEEKKLLAKTLLRTFRKGEGASASALWDLLTDGKGPSPWYPRTKENPYFPSEQLKENGPDRDDPSRLVQNHPETVGAVSNHPQEED